MAEKIAKEPIKVPKFLSKKEILHRLKEREKKTGKQGSEIRE